MIEQERPPESEPDDAAQTGSTPVASADNTAGAAGPEESPLGAVASADGPEAGDGSTSAGAAEPGDGEPAGDEALEAGDAKPTGRSDTRRYVLVTAFALVFALLAATTAGFLWWQYRQFYVSLDRADAATSAEIQTVRADLRRLEDELGTVDAELAARRSDLARVEQRLDLVPGRFATLEQRLESVQGGSVDARAQWLRAEAEYYLALANTELALAGNWDSAVAALELADEKLRELANPRFNTVRSTIAEELLALRSVRLPDMEGLVFSLGRLAERADSLPMRADAPDNFATGRAEADADEPGLARLWAGFKGALQGIVRVERRDTPPDVQLSAQERALARRQFVLELELARFAALRREGAMFQTSLDAARRILASDFDPEAATVEGAMALLTEMREFDVAPDTPDISGSLIALRNASPGGD